MALRVSDAEVKEIIETDIDDVTPFITAANLAVNDALSGEGLAAARLKEIERWLAAHLVAMRERQVASEGMLDSSVSYGGKFGMGLEFTQYGQQVNMLDPTGKIASLSKSKRAVVMKVL